MKRPFMLAAASAGAVVLAGVTGVAAPVTEHVGRQPDGSVITSTNQRTTPVGTQVEFTGRPTAVAVSPDGATAALLSGTGLAGPEVVTVDLASRAIARQYVTGTSGGSFAGIVYSADGRTIYASDSGGSIEVVPVSGASPSTISLPPAHASDSNTNPNPGGLALAPGGNRLLVALNRNNSLGVVDLGAGTTSEIAVGNAPHMVVAAGNFAYVSNEGGRRARPGDFTNGSSGTPIVADPYHGSATTGIVSVVDLSAGRQVAEIPVGLHPTALLLARGALWVANTNSDSVSEIDPASKRVLRTIHVTPFAGAPYGSSPTGLAMMRGGRLAVTLGRNNALAVYDVNQPEPVLEGLLPTGWYPSAVIADDAREQLLVANDKGTGSTAVSDHDATGRLPKLVQEYVGSASILPYPKATDLERGSVQVASNNGWDHLDNGCALAGAPPVAIPAHVGEPSTIQHVVYIIKENRTYDQILGDDVRGNGDPAEATYGLTVTPNAHALATQFPLFDNFYDSASLSADGHQWAVQADAPDYLEKAFGNFTRSYPAMGYDALAYLPGGFIWENALRHGKTVVNFAEYAKEGGQLPTTSDIPSNDAHVVRDYPGFALNIPDQTRADIFLSHFAQYVAAGSMANLTMIRLPDDHTGGTTPNTVSPAAQVADNDLALGRIVAAISNSQFWKDTAIFVEEDDSQAGTDHVDGHRSVLYMAGPYVRRDGLVDSRYYTQVNVVRTIEQILGLPPMNQMDLAAPPIREAFTNKPDFTPYTLIAAKIPLGQMNPGLANLSGLQREWAMASAAQDTTHTDAANADVINHANWYAARGYNTPYPGEARVIHPYELPSGDLKAAPEDALPAAVPPPAVPPSGRAAAAESVPTSMPCIPASQTEAASAQQQPASPVLPNTAGGGGSWLPFLLAGLLVGGLTLRLRPS